MMRRTGDQAAVRAEKTAAAKALVGATVRVVARRGYTLEGKCLDAWVLRNGGTALKIKPLDGSGPREVTTLEPVVVVTGHVAGG